MFIKLMIKTHFSKKSFLWIVRSQVYEFKFINNIERDAWKELIWKKNISGDNWLRRWPFFNTIFVSSHMYPENRR